VTKISLEKPYIEILFVGFFETSLGGRGGVSKAVEAIN
jgi:hypothetical protein